MSHRTKFHVCGTSSALLHDRSDWVIHESIDGTKFWPARRKPDGTWERLNAQGKVSDSRRNQFPSRAAAERAIELYKAGGLVEDLGDGWVAERLGRSYLVRFNGVEQFESTSLREFKAARRAKQMRDATTNSGA